MHWKEHCESIHLFSDKTTGESLKGIKFNGFNYGSISNFAAPQQLKVPFDPRIHIVKGLVIPEGTYFAPKTALLKFPNEDPEKAYNVPIMEGMTLMLNESGKYFAVNDEGIDNYEDLGEEIPPMGIGVSNSAE